MITLLIADDELYIRKGIRHTIPWEKHDIKIVGESSNGEACIQDALALHPDILLLDINMPVIDGLMVAKRLHDILPKTRIIFLTAYDTPQNLLSAIDIKASAFIVKSADSDSILQTVLNVKEEIERSRYILQQNKQYQDICNENYDLIKSSILSNLLDNILTVPQFLSKMSQLNVHIPEQDFTAILLHYRDQSPWQVLNKLSPAICRDEPAYFLLPEKLLFLAVPEPVQADALLPVMPTLQPDIYHNQMAVQNRIPSWDKIPDVYINLQKGLNFCFWDSGIPFYQADSSVPDNAFLQETLYKLEQDLITALHEHNKNKSMDCWNRYKNYMLKNQPPQNTFLDSVIRLLSMLNSTELVIPEKAYSRDWLIQLSPGEILENTRALLTFSETVPETQIKLALKYIDAHFTEDISLNDVADAVYLSSGYLSRSLKQYTGRSFREYLNQVRLNKAKELIVSTNLRYYQIAKMVGYNDYKYFSLQFRKYCGCSAKEYRYGNWMK